MRKSFFSDAQALAYENTDPILMVRGEKQYLYDETGKQYLDTRNNVPHVGHCHPHVVAAVQRQVAELNTNTRYLHPNLALLAKVTSHTRHANAMTAHVARIPIDNNTTLPAA